jgi:hypothetical protein
MFEELQKDVLEGNMLKVLEEIPTGLIPLYNQIIN